MCTDEYDIEWANIHELFVIQRGEKDWKKQKGLKIEN